jgi:hypothetical protein
LAEIVTEIVDGGCAEGADKIASRLLDEGGGMTVRRIAETRPPAWSETASPAAR